MSSSVLFVFKMSLLYALFDKYNSDVQKTAKSGLHILLGGVCALTIVVFLRFVSISLIEIIHLPRSSAFGFIYYGYMFH